MHRALVSAIVASGMLAIAGAASAADILEDSQLDEVTAGGVASANFFGIGYARSDTGNDATTWVIGGALTYEDANDNTHIALSGGLVTSTSGN